MLSINIRSKVKPEIVHEQSLVKLSTSTVCLIPVGLFTHQHMT